MRPDLAGVATAGAEVRLLLRLDVLRARAAVARPTGAVWLGVGIPATLIVGLLAFVGRAALPSAGDAEAAVLLGLLVAGPVAFLARPVLFGGADLGLLRKLGIAPAAIYGERVLRLAATAVSIAGLLLLPFVAAGESLARPAAVGLAAGLSAWGAGALSLSAAARAMSGHTTGRAWGLLSVGMWDREIAAAAPLVWAPLAPLLVGAAAAGVVGAAPGHGLFRAGVIAAASAVPALLAARPYAASLSRFAPQALEMAFERPATSSGGSLRVGGLARALPRRAALVRSRDSVVGARRFAWAGRIVWPVVIGGVVTLARWGDADGARGWVGSAAALALLLQAAAVVGLGRMERGGLRWIDRSVGITRGSRLLGRWAWGWGMSLWLAVPLGLAWRWWAGGEGWEWLAAGAATAGMAALASEVAAGGA